MLDMKASKPRRLWSGMSWSLVALLMLGVTGNVAMGQKTEKEVDIKIKVSTEEDRTTTPPFDGTRASVDVAILLDTSNSMDGLISQAKSQLWNIVQQFAAAKRNGQTPQLRVAVFEYGNSGLPASENYIRQAVGLTDDLDKISEILFALTTNGGDEYCGAVVGEALKRLDWSNEPNSYKAIFIAGNEPFTQGPVNYKDTCRDAIQAGVIVNTIHCGERQAGMSGEWQAGALLAEGKFLNINQDQQVFHIECPQDKIIIELSSKLNDTYLWYGAETQREAFAENQIAQDRNAMGGGMGGGGAAGRGGAKASAMYSNRGRDLVDTYEDDMEILSKVAVEDLPTEMQAMSAEERLEHLKKMLAERNELRKQIQELDKERQEFLQAEMKKQGQSEEATFGGAMKSVVIDQLEASGFEVEK